MSSVRKETFINAPSRTVWSALRDFGALHTRLVPGFVTNTQLEPGARIVTTASMAHSWGRLNPDDLSRTKSPYNVWLAYGASKAANILFAAESARRWPELLSFSYHPGVVRSNFGTPAARFFYKIGPGLKSPEQGADTLVHLATAPAADLVNGGYYDERKPVRPKAYLEDRAIAARLWERSLELTGL